MEIFPWCPPYPLASLTALDVSSCSLSKFASWGSRILLSFLLDYLGDLKEAQGRRFVCSNWSASVRFGCFSR